MDIIYEIRRRHSVQKQTVSAIAREMGISRPTVRKHLNTVAEPRYERVQPIAPKLGEFEVQLTQWLEQEAKLPRPRRRSAHRLFEGLLELAALDGPWALGAITCVVHIMELTGNSRMQRCAITALFWMLWRWRFHFALEADFENIWKIVVDRFRDVAYVTPDGNSVKTPITNKDLERFDQAVSSFKTRFRPSMRAIRKEANDLLNEVFRTTRVRKK